MAVTQIHNTPQRPKIERGMLTQALISWSRDGVNCGPFFANNGPEAASMILLKAYALTECLSAGFDSAASHPESEFDQLVDGSKALALEAIGDLILLAKALTDEA